MIEAAIELFGRDCIRVVEGLVDDPDGLDCNVLLATGCTILLRVDAVDAVSVDVRAALMVSLCLFADGVFAGAAAPAAAVEPTGLLFVSILARAIAELVAVLQGLVTRLFALTLVAVGTAGLAGALEALVVQMSGLLTGVGLTATAARLTALFAAAPVAIGTHRLAALAWTRGLAVSDAEVAALAARGLPIALQLCPAELAGLSTATTAATAVQALSLASVFFSVAAILCSSCISFCSISILSA